MNCSETIKLYSTLSLEIQIRFLVLLSYELTIMGRDTYEADSNEIAYGEKMRGINEIQHAVSQTILKLLENDPKRWPDSTVIKIIYETGDTYHVSSYINYSVEHAFKFCV